jgi:putative transposase
MLPVRGTHFNPEYPLEEDDPEEDAALSAFSAIPLEYALQAPASPQPCIHPGLLALLGIDQSHSRPHVSKDNPYSEAHFKTFKYCPAFPGRLGSIKDANVFFAQFFDYYNNEHRHSGIGMHTPATVHDGTAATIHAKRVATLNAAFQAHPERFRGRRPYPPSIPTKAWINQPQTTPETDAPQTTQAA